VIFFSTFPSGSCSATTKHNDTQHNDTQYNDTLYNTTKYWHAECHRTETSFILSVANKPIMLSVVMQKVIMICHCDLYHAPVSCIFSLAAHLPLRITTWDHFN
jgi:hypothetical protein